MFKLLVLVPVFNHARSLARVLADLCQLGLPILVVDDGSTDGIDSVLEQFPTLFLLRQERNHGKGEALKKGMLWALTRSFDSVLTFDADGQHLLADARLLLAAWQKEPKACFIGVRNFKAAQSGPIPYASKIGRALSNFFVMVETGNWMNDTQSGLRIYALNKQLLGRIKAQGFHFEVEYIVKAQWLGHVIKNIPTGVFYPQPELRISHYRKVKDTYLMVILHIQLLFLRLLMAIKVYDLKNSKPAELAGAGFLAWAVKRLGINFCYGVMPIAVLGIFIKEAKKRQAIMELYKRLRPRAPWLSLVYYSFDNFWYFAMSLLDRLNARASFRFLPPASSQATVWQEALKQPSLFIGAHYGDWILVAMKHQELFERPLGLVIDPQGTPNFMQRVLDASEGRIRVVDPFQDALPFILEVKTILDEQGHVCFLGDRLQGRAQVFGVSLPFLGGLADFQKAPFELAVRLGVPIVYFGCVKQGRGPRAPYQIYLHAIYDGREKISALDLVKRYVSRLEEQVQKAPQHWFNFVPFW